MVPNLQRHTRGIFSSLAMTLCAHSAFGASLFSAYTAIPTGSWPEAVAIGDVNGDGRNDVVLVTSYYFSPENDYKLFVFLQDATGALQPPIKYNTAGTYTNPPRTVAIGDVDGDGFNDVVVGLSGLGLQVFPQSGTQLGTPTLIATPYSDKIRIGDLNGDGRQDVAGIGWAGDKVGVFTRTSNGTLTLNAEYAAPHGGYDDLELGDLNNDTRTDIVVMSGQTYAIPNIAVLTQKSDGTFSPFTPYTVGINLLTRGVGIGDINGDGLQDLVASIPASAPNSQIALFTQDGAGTLNPASTLASNDNPIAVDAKDLNGDGRDDVIVLHGGLSKIGFYLQNPDGTLGPEQTSPIPNTSYINPHALAVGDFNGDGKPDVAIADYNRGLVLLTNAPSSLNTPPVARLSGPSKANRITPATFDASASSDPDGDKLTYIWNFGGPMAVGSTSATTTVTFTQLGTYTVTLTVSDGTDSASANQSVLVENLLPSATAGNPQTVSQKSSVMLNGAANDPDGQIASYLWKQTSGPTVNLKNASTATPTFTAPSLSKTTSVTLGFRLQVTDNDGGVASATTTVTVLKR